VKKTFLALIVIIVLAYVVGTLSTKTLRTEIAINAPPKIIWKHLTDFDKHNEWNPFIKSISGKISVGSQLSVTIQSSGQDAMDFKPELLVVKENEELRWLGRVFMPKLFDGEHYFILEGNSDGGTRLIQGENFTGILAYLLWGSIEQDTRNGFEEMNSAIKARSEVTK
jgi:hypothetical protein